MSASDRIIADLRVAAYGATAAIAEVLDMANREILNVPAPINLIGGRLRATAPATPGAPPRRVTGNLQVHANRYYFGDGVWFVGVFGVAYAHRLEFDTNHAFISVTLQQQRGAMEAAMSLGARARSWKSTTPENVLFIRLAKSPVRRTGIQKESIRVADRYYATLARQEAEGRR